MSTSLVCPLWLCNCAHNTHSAGCVQTCTRCVVHKVLSCREIIPILLCVMLLCLPHQLCMWFRNAPFSPKIGKDLLHIGHKVTGRKLSNYSPLQKKKKRRRRRRNRKPKFKHIWQSAKYPTFIQKILLVAQLISTLVLNFRDDDGWSWWMPTLPPNHEAFLLLLLHY